MKIQIKECIKNAQKNGKEVTMQSVGRLLFGTEASAHVSMSYLCNGQRKKIAFDHIERLCSALDCTPNDLFGYNTTNNQ